MKYHCPKCESENIQLLRLVYESGTSKSRGTSLSIGGITNLRSSAAMASVTESKSSSATLIASRLAPPKQKVFQSGCLILGIFACGCVAVPSSIMFLVSLGSSDADRAASVMGTLIVAAPSVWGVWTLQKKIGAEKNEIERYNTEDYPRLKAEWEASWLCHKCGYVGKINET